jgi:hypothetical protein
VTVQVLAHLHLHMNGTWLHEQEHAAVGQHALLHGEALLVLPAHDLEDIAGKLLQKAPRVSAVAVAPAGVSAAAWLLSTALCMYVIEHAPTHCI